MKLKGSKHLYTVVPNWPGNRDLPPGERIEFDLEGVSQADLDALELVKAGHHADKARDEATRLCVESTKEMLRQKFKGVRGLQIEGVGEIRTFDEFYAHAPKELVNWVSTAVFDTFVLLAAEAKNSAPPSGSACGNRSAAPPGSAAPATSDSDRPATATTAST